MSVSSVTLEDVLGAAAARAASLVPETSGYLALAVGDATSRLPFRVEDRAVSLTTEGSVVVARGADVVQPAESARSLRDVLARLLSCSAGTMPGLSAAAKPRAERDVLGVVAQIEAALIPVNRAAARRALARLARETLRAKDAGKIRRVTERPVAPPRAEPEPPRPPEPPAPIVAAPPPAPTPRPQAGATPLLGGLVAPSPTAFAERVEIPIELDLSAPPPLADAKPAEEAPPAPHLPPALAEPPLELSGPFDAADVAVVFFDASETPAPAPAPALAPALAPAPAPAPEPIASAAPSLPDATDDSDEVIVDWTGAPPTPAPIAAIAAEPAPEPAPTPSPVPAVAAPEAPPPPVVAARAVEPEPAPAPAPTASPSPVGSVPNTPAPTPTVIGTSWGAELQPTRAPEPRVVVEPPIAEPDPSAFAPLVVVGIESSAALPRVILFEGETAILSAPPPCVQLRPPSPLDFAIGADAHDDDDDDDDDDDHDHDHEATSLDDAPVESFAEFTPAPTQPMRRVQARPEADLDPVARSSVEDLLKGFGSNALDEDRAMRAVAAGLKSLAGLEPTPPPLGTRFAADPTAPTPAPLAARNPSPTFPAPRAPKRGRLGLTISMLLLLVAIAATGLYLAYRPDARTSGPAPRAADVSLARK